MGRSRFSDTGYIGTKITTVIFFWCMFSLGFSMLFFLSSMFKDPRTGFPSMSKFLLTRQGFMVNPDFTIMNRFVY